ncbi:hypothetical protein RFI_30771 [Reticulomyxa filosa]|uniref:Viral A-type inclusion protein n=1 Tax=Reticulomyxa filosa TaxID=46433 RepID=X6LZ21_RETFI|nr:hypothetical protein RFI_30771 [Reticulomyxa filosa]|eukprot:ETO06621.1 hypothetical protein RFI_30771 [Reticulomyxa filosa]
MLLIDAETRTEEEEESKENKSSIFSFSDCYSKDWASLTNEPQKLNTLICCICNEIANNAMELHCDEHENADQVYLVGEQCLQNYLKQNNEKCPIEQHEYCEFSQSRSMRKLVSELLVICPRQFDLKKRQLNEGIKSGGEEGELWNGSTSNLNSKKNCNCNYKGKMKDLKDHLDNSCNLISTKQNISNEITDQLNEMSKQIKELQNVIKSQTVLSFFEQIKDLKEESLKKDEQIFKPTKDIQQFKIEMNQTIIDLKNQQNEQNKQQNDQDKQIDHLKHELQEKDQTITALTDTIQQLKTDNIEFKQQLKQYQIKFEQYKQNTETKVENQNTNIKQLQLQIQTQFEEEQKEQEQDITELKYNKNCQHMASVLMPLNLRNGIDFLLVTENRQTIQLKNNEWNTYNFGIFLLGENITLTLNCDRLEHLKIKTSHLWIKYSSSRIDCSKLGYPGDQGPGKGKDGGGGGYGKKGKGNDGQGGEINSFWKWRWKYIWRKWWWNNSTNN